MKEIVLPFEKILIQVVSLLNGQGGKVECFSLKNGVQLFDEQKNLLCADGLKKAIKKYIRPEFVFTVDEKKENLDTVLTVLVPDGDAKPYYLNRNKDITGNIYINGERVGNAETKALIEKYDGEKMHGKRSLCQNLTFFALKQICEKKYVTWNRDFLKEYGLLKGNLYTDLALLISDQNPYETEVFLFEGSMQLMKEHKIFQGCICKQYEDIMAYLHPFCPHTDGLFPQKAVAESVINALLHRSYANEFPVLVKIYEDKAEILSPGGIPKNFSCDDIRTGGVFTDNPKLLKLCRALHYCEGCGMGLDTVFQCYQKMTNIPKITASVNTFKISLPALGQTVNPCPAKSQMDYVMTLFEKSNTITRTDIEKCLCVSRATAARIANAMVENKLISKVGTGRFVYYLKVLKI